MSALLLSPAILFPPSGPGPSPGRPGGGGGGGEDPLERPTEPRAPRGGLPLPDAEQSPERIRDHDRPGRRRVPVRRPAQEPQPMPAPAPAPGRLARSGQGVEPPRRDRATGHDSGALSRATISSFPA